MLADRRMPVSVLTGFLGSGKTTVLNRLLRDPAMARVMVIINEFGEIGIDHELVESATDDMILLQSGCLCCTVRSDLIETIQALLLKQERSEIPEFDRIVIETTGLADPAPILQAVMTDPMVTNRLSLDGVIATVDAVVGEATLDRHMEAVKQIAVSDRLLLTKTDLVEENQCLAIERRLRALNPGAPIIHTLDGEIEPHRLFDVGLYNPATKSLDVQRWLDDEKYKSGSQEEHEGHDGGIVDHHGQAHEHRAADVNRHDSHINAVCMVVDEPIPGEALDRWLGSLFLLNGPDLLRFKAIINVAELPGPMILHGVQHVIHPPTMLKRWPSDDRRTRMVFITHDIDEHVLRDSLKRFMGETVSAGDS
jgi:G3E family GTPase